MKKSQNDSEPIGEQTAFAFPVGFRSDHAKDLVSPDLEPEQKMTVTSGRNLSEQLTDSTPIGLLAKMLLESSVWKINPAFTGMYSLKWTIVKLPAFQKLTTMRQYTHDRLKCSSEVSVKVLKKEDMKSKRLLFRLQVLVHRTKGNVSGLLHTPQAQEPGSKVENLQTKDGQPAKIGERAYDIKTGRLAQVGLTQQIQMLPTPSAMMPGDVDMEKLDARREKCKANKKNGNGFGPSLNELAVKGMLPIPKAQNKNQPSVHGNGGLDLQTYIAKQMLPTPTTSTGGANHNSEAVTDRGHGINLKGKIQSMMNTPTAQDADNSTLPKSQLNLDSVVGDILKTGVTGQLNPQFVGEMMGFPKNWTVLPFLNGETKALKDLEMP